MGQGFAPGLSPGLSLGLSLGLSPGLSPGFSPGLGISSVSGNGARRLVPGRGAVGRGAVAASVLRSRDLRAVRAFASDFGRTDGRMELLSA